MNKETIKVAVEVLKNSIKESDEMFHKKEVSHSYIIGMLQGAMSAVAEFLEKQVERAEDLEMIERMEQEDFDKRDIGF